MKAFKIILGLLVVGGGIFLGWQLLGNNNSVKEAELAEQYQIEEERFTTLETSDFATLPEAQPLIAEGSALVRNFSAIDENKVNNLKNINEQLEKVYAQYAEENEANALTEFGVLTAKIKTFQEMDKSKLTDKEKTEVEDLLAQGQAIINNRMAVSEPKVNQLKEVVTSLETILG